MSLEPRLPVTPDLFVVLVKDMLDVCSEAVRLVQVAVILVERVDHLRDFGQDPAFVDGVMDGPNKGPLAVSFVDGKAAQRAAQAHVWPWVRSNLVPDKDVLYDDLDEAVSLVAAFQACMSLSRWVPGDSSMKACMT